MQIDNPSFIVEIVAFGHNRGPVLESFVTSLHHYLGEHLPSIWLLTIADNGSTDDTWSIASGLASDLPNTRLARLEQRMGRKELRFEWTRSEALVAAFIEVRPNPDFDQILAPLIADANRHSRSPVSLNQPSDANGVFTRRQALSAIGTVGLGAFLAACSRNAGIVSTTSTSTTAPAETTTSGSSTSGATTPVATLDCVLVPEMTEGPYYLDLDLDRSDITEDRVGAPLALTIVVATVDACTPIQDAAVDLWHCDAEGIYSGFVAASTGGGGGTDDSIFLRGTQLTDASGQATFQTLYPGWYRGRTVHMHMKVHVGGNQIHTTQLFFDDSFTDQVYAANEPYSARTDRDTFNSNDGIYQGGGEATTLTVTEAGDGFAATLIVGVQSRLPVSRAPTAPGGSLDGATFRPLSPWPPPAGLPVAAPNCRGRRP